MVQNTWLNFKSKPNLLAVSFILILLLSACAQTLTGQPAVPILTPTNPAAPTATLTAPSASPTPLTQPWSEFERMLSARLALSAQGKCEWEVYGWQENEVYLWALCLSAPMPNATGASLAVALTLDEEGSIVDFQQPSDGSLYAPSIQKIFPPEVQKKIFAHQFDARAAQARIEKRWLDPSLPPLIVEESGQALPKPGEASVPAISTQSIDRLQLVLKIGEGLITTLQPLDNGGTALISTQKITFFDSFDQEAFSISLDKKKGNVSPDGSLYVTWQNDQVSLYKTTGQELKQTIKITSLEGQITNCIFLPDNNTLLVEVHPPGEEIYSNQVEIYDLTTGTLIHQWNLQGMGMLISENGQVLTTRYFNPNTAVWSVPDGTLLTTSSQFWKSQVLWQLALSPDGSTLAVQSIETLKLLNLLTGEETASLPMLPEALTGMLFSSDGKNLLLWTHQKLFLWHIGEKQFAWEAPIRGISQAVFDQQNEQVILAFPGSVVRYDPVEKKQTVLFEGVYPAVADLVFSADLSTEPTLAVLHGINTETSTLTHWKIPDGTLIFQQEISHSSALEFTSQPAYLVVAGMDGTVTLLDPLSAEVKAKSDPLPEQLISLTNNPYWITAGSLNRVVYFPPFPGQILQSFELTPAGNGWITGLDSESWSIAAGSDGTISIFDFEEKTVKDTLSMDPSGDGYEAFVKADWPNLLSAQNQTFYHWFYDKSDESWDLLSKWETPSVITAFTLSPDHSLAVIGLADGTIQLLDWENETLLRTLDGHGAAITTVDFSVFGDYFASGYADGVITIWGIESLDTGAK